MIFAHNGPAPGDKVGLIVQPPSPYARRVPLHFHPSNAPRKKGSVDRWVFAKYVESTEEPDIEARNRPDHSSRTNRSSIGGEGVEWGSWFGFKDKEERITPSSIPFLVDVFPNLPPLLPRSERKGMVKRYVLSVSLSIIHIDNRLINPGQLVPNCDSFD